MIIPLGGVMMLPGGAVVTQRVAKYVAPEPVKVDADSELTWEFVVQVSLAQRGSRHELETGETRPGGRETLANSLIADDPMSSTVILFVEKAAEHERPAAKLAELGPLSDHAVHLAALMLGADVTESDPSTVWFP
jgi:hypothetical protein